MEKIYLKDLSYEDLKRVISGNNEFIAEYSERLYEDNMFWQEEEGKNMFGNEHYKYIDIRDNYTSFYLVLKDWHKFIDNLDSDYLCVKGKELYDYIIAKRDVLYNMSMYSNRYDDLEGHLEEKSKELLEICEEQLHEYENYPSNDEVVDAIIDCEWYLDKDYYTDKDMKTIYYDVAYTKKYE